VLLFGIQIVKNKSIFERSPTVFTLQGFNLVQQHHFLVIGGKGFVCLLCVALNNMPERLDSTITVFEGGAVGDLGVLVRLSFVTDEPAFIDPIKLQFIYVRLCAQYSTVFRGCFSGASLRV
jgi:hypothetical protein